jgi:hypothetical protein
MIAGMLARQLRQLRREAVVAIHVSREDFPHDAALAAMVDKAGTGSLAVTASADLPAGECRIDLQLGSCRHRQARAMGRAVGTAARACR